MATPTTSFLMPSHLRAVRYLAPFGVCYLNNPKVGCTSVKRVMWLMEDARRGVQTFAGNPHDAQAAPFGRQGDLAAALDAGTPVQVFSMVRNPYVRALSAYLSKIGPKVDRHVWSLFCKRYGLDPKGTLRFRQFLRLLTFDAPEAMDQHFAPQVVNLMQPWLPLDAIYRLEDPAPLWRWLGSFGQEVTATEASNRKDARGKLSEYYDEASVKLVRRLYAADFEAFGYSTDFEAALDMPSAPVPAGGGADRRRPVFCIPPLAKLNGALAPEQAAQRLAPLRASLGMLAPPGWFDYLRLMMCGARTQDDLATLEQIAEAQRTNWPLLDDLERIARQARAEDLSRRISAIRAETLLLHRDALPSLSYLPSPGPASAEAAA